MGQLTADDDADAKIIPMTSTPRWFTEMEEGHSAQYAEHFRELVTEGVNIEGEARFIDALIPPGSRVLDAGCGQGRLTQSLQRRGHHTIGVDLDDVLLDAARVDHPGPIYLRADLTTLDLAALGHGEPLDAVVLAGNVITFVAPEAEVATLRALRRHLRPGGVCVAGFQPERYGITTFDADALAAGFIIEQRFATWDLRPWDDEAEFAVTVLRNPDE
ncbi:MAG: class I SAM-dependent methyltransferase [Candidatus Nanopelagicales bacterium]|nr:class I SAM-dependent methyltransferase [Candidatus Nanopelagicales bacterium]